MRAKQRPPVDPGAARPRLRRIVNFRLLVETLLVAAIIGPAAYFWYSHQVTRTAEAMLERAGKLVEEKGDDDAAANAEAAKYYFQYLKLRPGDAKVQALLAETLDRAAKEPAAKARAVEYYYEAIGIAPPDQQRDLRRRLAELLITLGRFAAAQDKLKRFAAAEDEARSILRRDPNDPAGCRLLALALYHQSAGGRLSGGRDLSAVGQAVLRAAKLNPADVEIAAILASIYRAKDGLLLSPEQKNLSTAAREKLADQVMDKMVAANPNDVKALLERHLYLLRYHPETAERDLATLTKRYPEDLDVVLRAAAESRRAAAVAQQKGQSPKEVQARLEEARKQYEHASRISPGDKRAYLLLADLYRTEGKIDAVVTTLRSGQDQLKKKGKGDEDLLNGLAEALLAQGKLKEAGETIARLENAAQRVAPFQPVPVKLAMKRDVDLLRGRWLLAKGRYLEAMALLRRAAADQPTNAEETRRSLQAWQCLSEAFAALRQWDQAAVAQEHAAALQPTAAVHHRNAAAAWMLADRLDVAEQHYRQALSLQPSAETQLDLAVVLFDMQRRRPKAERNWDPFNKALAEAKQAGQKQPLSNGWRLKLLEADYLTAIADEPKQREKSIAAAIAICRDVEHGGGDAPELLPRLATAYERLGQSADVDRLLKQLETIKGQEATACLLKARSQISRKQYEQARKTLLAALDTLPQPQRAAVRQELIGLDLSEGKADQAREQLLAAIKADPKDLNSLVQLAEIALQERKPAEIERWETELRKLEGDNGIFWRYYQALRLLAQASGPGDEKLAEATKLQAYVQSQRPTWSKAYVLEGLLAEKRGDFDQAVEACRGAISFGERSPLIFENLILRLLKSHQLEEADRYLTIMRDRAPASPQYASLETIVAATRGQIDRALQAARRAAEQDPANPRAQLRLGQLLSAAGKATEAEAALKKAVALAPDDLDAHKALFAFLRAKRPADARKLLEQVAKEGKLGKTDQLLFLARSYEGLGDKNQASSYYRQAAQLDSQDSAGPLALADYLWRTGTPGNRGELERLLRELRQKFPGRPEARWMLAGLLVERNGKQALQEAAELVEKPDKNKSIADIDRSIQAMVLSARGGREELNRARRILEELVADPKNAGADNRQLLATVYEKCGDVEAARRQYLTLVDRENVDLARLFAYVKLLLRQGLLDEADVRLKSLEARLPDNREVAILRAGWLHSKDQGSKIEPLLEPLAEKLLKLLPKGSPDEAAFLLEMGELYSSLDQHKAAERWCRRLMALQPKRYLPLAVSLAQQGRMKEAVELCSKAAATDSSTAPQVGMAVVLLTGNASAEDFASADPLLSKAAADHKDDATLATTLGNVRVAQQRLDEAADLFRGVLALQPNNADALNNLATVLAERPETRKEALRCIDRAIEIAGRRPNLLDTQGTILLLDGKAADAVALLQQAAASPLADPRYHLHLAVAYDRARQPEKARRAFHTACKNQLTKQVLTPSDRSVLAELQKKFD